MIHQNLKIIASKNRWFSKFAKWAAHATGQPMSFLLAVAVIGVWGITGPLFNFNDSWQLTINTGTTIVTFLMVFLIQNAQNRDSVVLQLKLDELIYVTKDAEDTLLDLEELEEAELILIQKKYLALAKEARELLRQKMTSENL